jgi:hypothetical protein
MSTELAEPVNKILQTIAVPVSVSIGTVWGIPLSDWVYIFTLIYLVVHIGYISYKWFKGK